MGAYGAGTLWFWAAALLLWRGLCGSTLGAPNALLLGSGRSAEDAALFDRLARRNVAEAAASWRRSGVLSAALAGFLLAFLTVFAAMTASVLAFDAFALAAPALVFAGLSARTALALDRERPEPAALRARFLRLRAFGHAAMLASFALIAAPRLFFALLIV